MKPTPPLAGAELPRLIRYVSQHALPDGDRLLAVLDKSQNLLVINKDLFEGLTYQQKKEVWRTDSDSIVIAH